MSDEEHEREPLLEPLEIDLENTGGQVHRSSASGRHSVDRRSRRDIRNARTKSTSDKRQLETSRAWTVNQAINRIGSGPFQMWMLFLCGLSEAADGIQQLAVSFLIHYLGNAFALTTQMKALIGTVSGFGMLVGAACFGRASDVYGRKVAFAGSLLMSGAFGVLCATAPNYPMFLILRFLLSIGIGGNVPLAFTIFTEFSPKSNRGGYLTMLEGFWSVGAVISCLFAWATLPTNGLGWKYYQLFCAVPSLILAFVVIFKMPETPRYSVISGNIGAAQITLKRMAIENKRSQLREFQLKTQDPSNPTTFNPTFWDLFSNTYRRTSILLLISFFMLSFGCGVFVWMPVLLQAKKLEVLSMYRSMVIMALSQVPGVLFSAYLVERIGRKKTIGIFFLGGAFFMIIFALVEGQQAVVVSSILMEFFLAGANGALSAYTVEVFPTSLRSSAMGACSSISRLSSIANPTVWAALLDISVQLAVSTGVLALIIGFCAVMMLRVETMNHDLKDVAKKKV